MKTLNIFLFAFICLALFSEGQVESSPAPGDSGSPVETPQEVDLWSPGDPGVDPYYEAILRTSEMAWDSEAMALAQSYGMQVMNITWEDTGRFYDSSVGNNISDMSIQVGYRQPGLSDYFEVHLMPVIRYPNFEDLSTDLSPWDFTLLVGNERDSDKLLRVSLYEFLENPRQFLSDPQSWPGETKSLLAPRDEKVLVSAQAAFLPIPQSGEATFNPVLFNYQSYQGNPAVLTILATREGTSVTIIDNTRDAFDNQGVWGQRLFFNKNGERASLTGRRESEFLADPENAQLLENTPSVGNERGLNMVLMIQVPLIHEPMGYWDDYSTMEGLMYEDAIPAPTDTSRMSDVENAVIGSGPVEGPFTEIDGQEIKRDPDYPIRVTVQFYKATSNGIMNEGDMKAIATQISNVYDQGDYISSLVTGGDTGRITEYYGSKVQPADWWDNFWDQYERTTGISREEARRKLMELVGPRYYDEPVSSLYLRDILR